MLQWRMLILMLFKLEGLKMDNLKDYSIEELQRLVNEGHQCDFLDCCEYGKYDQCHNHSHVLCENYEVYYTKTHKPFNTS